MTTPVAEFEDTSGGTSDIPNKAESMARCGSFKEGIKLELATGGHSEWMQVGANQRPPFRPGTRCGYRIVGFRHAGLVGSDLDIFQQGKGFQGSILIM
ncbi:hypothetical protein N7449_011188 [Penicillium cf. viridicatum]|uniref:Uncharacterized protein n=1 Tax=Penicillium cf. viridicatum TaxID=2972119 RepID=A0A9W9IYK5_9EURO|nr:hypothetical protein N7449_011188 [Penicillium cf. viridicatum]